MWCTACARRLTPSTRSRRWRRDGGTNRPKTRRVDTQNSSHSNCSSSSHRQQRRNPRIIRGEHHPARCRPSPSPTPPGQPLLPLLLSTRLLLPLMKASLPLRRLRLPLPRSQLPSLALTALRKLTHRLRSLLLLQIQNSPLSSIRRRRVSPQLRRRPNLWRRRAMRPAPFHLRPLLLTPFLRLLLQPSSPNDPAPLLDTMH